MENNKQELPVTLELRIDWAELDLFRHVNNVAFTKYVQAARVHYWEQIGLYQHFLATNLGPMLISVSCQYRKPLFYPGSILIRTGLRFIGTTSFGLRHEIYDEQGTLAAEAEDVMVFYDFNKNEKAPFPAAIRLNAEALERKTFPKS